METEKQRERLVELLNEATYQIAKACIGNCEGCGDKIADYLIANNVVVLPCKVGDTVYRVAKHRGVWEVLPREVVSITYRLDHLYRVVFEIFSTEYDRLGKTVFLTREEAENALKERKENDK